MNAKFDIEEYIVKVEGNQIRYYYSDKYIVSHRFADYVNVTVASLHPIHCTRQRKVEVEFDMTTIPAFVVVGLVLWFVLKPRRPKPKIN